MKRRLRSLRLARCIAATAAAAGALYAAPASAALGVGVMMQPPEGGLSITGASSIVSTGGSSTVIGMGFASGCTASVNIAGTVYSLSVTFVNSTELTVVLAPGTYAVSSPFWPLTVRNPSGATVTAMVFMINAVATPSSTLGANCILWLSPSSYSAGVWTDLCAYHQNASFGVDPTVGSFPGGATGLVFDGATVQAEKTGFSIEGGSALWMFVVSDMTTGGSVEGAAIYSSADQIRYNSSTVLTMYGGAGSPGVSISGTSRVGDTIGWYGYDVYGDAGNTNGILQGLGPPETTVSAPSVSLPATGTLYLGSLGSSSWFNGIMGDVVFANIHPTSTVIAAIYNYENQKYGLDLAPQILGVTLTQPGGGPIRIGGMNFSQGGTASTTFGGIGSLGSTTYRSTEAVEATVPSGSYSGMGDVTVTNADSEAFTKGGAQAIAPIVDAWACIGTPLVWWVRADQVTCAGGPCANGSNVTGAIDLSWMNSANPLTQPTMAYQPTWTASNASFGGAPTIHFGGSQFLSSSLFNFGADSWGDTISIVLVMKETAPSSGGALALSINNGSGGDEMIFISGKPYMSGQGNSAEWGSSVLGSAGIVYGYDNLIHSGTIGVSWNFGTLVTASPSGETPNYSPTITLGARSDGTFPMTVDIAEAMVVNTQLTSPMISCLTTLYSTEYGL